GRGVRLRLTPVAVQHILPRVDEPPRMGHSIWVHLVCGHLRLLSEHRSHARHERVPDYPTRVRSEPRSEMDVPRRGSPTAAVRISSMPTSATTTARPGVKLNPA